jgi:hypothetical protein
MRKTLTVAAACLMLVTLPAPASAWGVEAHRYIMRRAIDLLPAELKPFFERHSDEVVLRVVDPDVWRTAGWEDNHHHFLDFGAAAYGKFPFEALPRELDRAVEKFGRATVEEYGMLPWRLSEFFGNLRRAFEGFSRNNPYAASDTVLFAPAMSHYIQDAHQPLHAHINYDGADTGQRGIHSRFETELFNRYVAKLTVTPAPARAISSPRDFAFATLLDSYQLVDTLLAADKKATAGRDNYDDGYYEQLLAGTKVLLERRLGESITATASLILGAWEGAGRPSLTADRPRPVQRIRPPQE